MRFRVRNGQDGSLFAELGRAWLIYLFFPWKVGG
jgi:hypothetical protein